MNMNHYDLLVSARDAEALAAMLGRHRRSYPFEGDASDELADLLFEARLVPSETLPAGRVAMGSTVTYVEEPSGLRRTMTLAYPEEADPAKGRISVLSPVGRALLGRKRGATVVPDMPDGRRLRIRILDAAPGFEPLRHAA